MTRSDCAHRARPYGPDSDGCDEARFRRGASGAFTLAIGLLNRLGRGREALDVAEQARGRAFADLLASRDTVPSAAARREEGARSTRVTRERGADARSDGLVRGGEAGASPPVAALHSDRDLRSFASAAPLSSSELTQIAAVFTRRWSAFGSRRKRLTSGWCRARGRLPPCASTSRNAG